MLPRPSKGSVSLSLNAGAPAAWLGGSVKAANAGELLAVANVDGALVGGASLKAEEFWAIAASVG